MADEAPENWLNFVFDRDEVQQLDTNEHFLWSWAWEKNHALGSFPPGYDYSQDYQVFKAAVEAGDERAQEIMAEFVAWRMDEQGG